MPDVTDAPVAGVVDPRRRHVAIGTGMTLGPGHTLLAELPAQNIGERFRHGPVWIVEAKAVEMVRHRPIVIASYARQRAEAACGGSKTRQAGKKRTAGQGHEGSSKLEGGFVAPT